MMNSGAKEKPLQEKSKRYSSHYQFKSNKWTTIFRYFYCIHGIKRQTYWLNVRNALADKAKRSGGLSKTLWRTNGFPERFKRLDTLQ